MPISARKVVTIDYTLRNATGEVLDSSDDSEPLAYLHGADEIVPGLEHALEGLEVGDEKDVVVEAKDGYGEVNPGGVFPVPRSVFPSDMTIEVGDALVGEDDQGEMIPVRVVGIEGDKVMVDANHPLAGQRLHYHVKVRGVRDATDEEMAHGHSHDGGCGCEHEGCSCEHEEPGSN